MSATNEEILVSFWEAFDRLDIDAVVGFLTDDCVHDDKPVGVHTGKDEIHAFFSQQVVGLATHRAELRDTVSNGDVVMNERVDFLELKNGKKVVLPVMAAYEFRDGQIAVWRDYYDIGSFVAQLKAE